MISKKTEGWLERKTKVGFWSKRYFRLKNNRLTMFRNPTDSKPELEILMNSQIKTELGDFSDNKFKITAPKHETLYLKAATKNVMMKWILDIRGCAFTNPSLSMDVFDILSVIGRGFYGKVLLCQKKDTEELVAIKTVRKSRLLELKKVHTILNERTILVRQNHPYIITLKYAFQTDAKFYLCLEYAPGGDLYHFLKNKGTPPIGDIKLYITEISLAINALHTNDILYRDIKPENILLDEKGHVKLADFGLSKYMAKNDKSSTFCGTAEYMAPEIIINKGYGMEVDWWGVGILTYEMCFNATPFSSPNRQCTYQMIINKEPLFPKTADPTLVDFISMLLKKDPKDRGNFDSIKNHKFMEGMDFQAVYNKQVLPSVVPEIVDPRKPNNFDQKYTNEKAVDSVVPPGANSEEFVTGFSFSELDYSASMSEPNNVITSAESAPVPSIMSPFSCLYIFPD